MRGLNLCSLLMAALFWAGLTAAPLAAQNEADSPGFLRTDPAVDDADGNRLPSNWAGLSAKRLERRLTAPKCRSNYHSFVYFYPQGFGNVVLDGAIEKLASEAIEGEVEDRRQAGFCDQSVCGSASCGFWGTNRTFEIHRPSANYVSVLFTDYRDTGGAHPNTSYEGNTYSLQSGQPMSLLDLFPQPQESLPKYWEMVYKRWCENVGNKFPLHYRNPEPCGQPDSATNPNTYSWAADLADLGRLIFTPQGLSLVLGPYESGSHASGTVVMDFSREEMLAIGAAPSVWGQ